MNEINDERRGATSASAAQADLLCPGRHLAQRGLPDTQSEDAERGTRIHAALADNANMKKLSGEERDLAESCREIEKRLVAEFFGDAVFQDTRVFREQRYWVRVPHHPERNVFYEHSGQPDVVHRRGTRALVLDYKTGPADVNDSPSNMQLRDLCVLVRGNLLVQEVGCAIIQPLDTHKPEVCLYNRESLDRAEKEMFQRVISSNTLKGVRTAGEIQCKYCKAKPSCPEYNQWAAQSLPLEQPLAKPLIQIPVTDWTPEQRVQFCDALEPISAAFRWVEECKDHLKGVLQADPNAIPGWSLKPGATRDVIIKTEEVYARFLALGGTNAQFMPCVEIGKGKLKEALRSTTGEKGKALDSQLAKLLDGAVETKQNKPSLNRKNEK